jgi:hypothetical protein
LSSARAGAAASKTVARTPPTIIELNRFMAFLPVIFSDAIKD